MNFFQRIYRGYLGIIKNSTTLLIIIAITFFSSAFIVVPLWYAATQYPDIYSAFFRLVIALLILAALIAFIIVQLKRNRLRQLVGAIGRIGSVMIAIAICGATLLFQQLWAIVASAILLAIIVGLVATHQ